jgi:Tfp pilus assembly protein PilO
MELLKINKREQLLIIAVVLMASGVLQYRIMVYPELREIKETRYHLESQHELIELKSEEARQYKKMKERYKELKKEVSEIRDIFFSKEEAVGFLETLPVMIKQTGNDLIAYNPGVDRPLSETSKEKRGYYLKPIEVEVRGEYSEIIEFFKKIDGLNKLTNVSEISLKTARKNPIEVDLKVALDLYVYEDQEK